MGEVGVIVQHGVVCKELDECGPGSVGHSLREGGQDASPHCGEGDVIGNVQVVYLITSRSDGPEWYGRRLPIYGKRRSEQPVNDR
jgi:hypothetical protein